MQRWDLLLVFQDYGRCSTLCSLVSNFHLLGCFSSPCALIYIGQRFGLTIDICLPYVHLVAHWWKLQIHRVFFFKIFALFLIHFILPALLVEFTSLLSQAYWINGLLPSLFRYTSLARFSKCFANRWDCFRRLIICLDTWLCSQLVWYFFTLFEEFLLNIRCWQLSDLTQAVEGLCSIFCSCWRNELLVLVLEKQFRHYKAGRRLATQIFWLIWNRYTALYFWRTCAVLAILIFSGYFIGDYVELVLIFCPENSQIWLTAQFWIFGQICRVHNLYIPTFSSFYQAKVIFLNFKLTWWQKFSFLNSFVIEVEDLFLI